MVPNYKLAMFTAVKTVKNCLSILSMKYKLPIWNPSLVPNNPPTFFYLIIKCFVGLGNAHFDHGEIDHFDND